MYSANHLWLKNFTNYFLADFSQMITQYDHNITTFMQIPLKLELPVGWPHWPHYIFEFLSLGLAGFSFFGHLVHPVEVSPPAALRTCVACQWLHSSFASVWWREATVTAAFRTAWESCTPGSPSASTRRSPRQKTTPTWLCHQWASPCLWGCCSSVLGATLWLSWREHSDTTWTVGVGPDFWHGDKKMQRLCLGITSCSSCCENGAGEVVGGSQCCWYQVVWSGAAALVGSAEHSGVWSHNTCLHTNCNLINHSCSSATGSRGQCV